MKSTLALFLVAVLGIGCSPEVPDNSCTYAYDAECDEPSLCPSGTDAFDCGECAYPNDGECDEPYLCPTGTDYDDCGGGPPAEGGDQCIEMGYPSDSGGGAVTCTQGPCSTFSAGAEQGTCSTSAVTLCCALGGSSAGITVRYYDGCSTSVCDIEQARANWTSVCNSYSGTLYEGNCGG